MLSSALGPSGICPLRFPYWIWGHLEKLLGYCVCVNGDEGTFSGSIFEQTST